MAGMADERDAARRRVRDAAADRSSGAAEIARRAALTLAALPASDLLEAVRILVSGHPSMAPLWRLGAAVLTAADHREAALRFARDLLGEREAVAEQAARLLDGPVVTLSWSSTLVAALAHAGVPTACARSEPGGEGEKTAAYLAKRGVAAELVEDDEALRLAGSGRTVVVGADAVGPGGVVNKVLTRSLAEAARRSGGRSYALAGSSKLIGTDLPSPPPFERTPLSLLIVVTGLGPLDDAASAARRHPIPEPLTGLL